MKTIRIVLTIVCLLCVMTSCQDDCAKADKLRLQNKFEEAAELYQKAAEQGNAYAKWRLSMAYFNGDGVDFDEHRAAELLKEAADEGCEEAKCDFAFAHFFDWFDEIEIDPAEGKKLIEKLVKETDNSYVQSRYAAIYFEGLEDQYDEDKEKAISILEKVKDKNDPAYLALMAEIYFVGTDKIQINNAKAIDYLEKGYKNGARNCANRLARLYCFGGEDIEKDYSKMIEWLKLGVESNNKDCMLFYSNICLSEDTAYKEFHNLQKGIELLKKAARHGSGEAYFNLGNLYNSGDKLPKDDNKAFECWEKSANLRNPEGASNLAFAYIQGIGCEKDVNKAIEIYKKGVDWKGGFCAYRLAYIYGNGSYGIPKDNGLARDYLLKAAKYGDRYGCYELAIQYYNGSGLMPQSNEQAFAYAKIAADKGLVDACGMVSYFYENGIGCDKNLEKAKEYRDKATIKEDNKKE